MITALHPAVLTLLYGGEGIHTGNIDNRGVIPEHGKYVPSVAITAYYSAVTPSTDAVDRHPELALLPDDEFFKIMQREPFVCSISGQYNYFTIHKDAGTPQISARAQVIATDDPEGLTNMLEPEGEVDMNHAEIIDKGDMTCTVNPYEPDFDCTFTVSKPWSLQNDRLNRVVCEVAITIKPDDSGPKEIRRPSDGDTEIVGLQ